MTRLTLLATVLLAAPAIAQSADAPPPLPDPALALDEGVALSETSIDTPDTVLLRPQDGSVSVSAPILPEPPSSTEPALPAKGIFVTHAYNFDFEEGAWGVRGTFPLPLDHPVGIAAGLDYFPENEFSSLTAVYGDLTYSAPLTLVGRGAAYGGFGPRWYRSSFESGGMSESNSEFGFGAVLGATYPVGPVTLYGDIGTDRVFDDWNCFTRFGLGFEFGDE